MCADESHLDLKYFVDPHVYNCPFCNRRNVAYNLLQWLKFDWTDSKECFVYKVQCASCENESLHLSFEDLLLYPWGNYENEFRNVDIDQAIFYSVPTSFFVLDDRIPAVIRELISEADGCLRMNFLTGASACARKAIYELLVREKTTGDSYEDKIKALKKKYPDTDPELFDILGHIQNMTSDKVHEQSWPKWSSQNLTLILETLKVVLQDIYVAPQVKAERSKRIQQLRSEIKGTPPKGTE
jgi:hypothetical protein